MPYFYWYESFILLAGRRNSFVAVVAEHPCLFTNSGHIVFLTYKEGGTESIDRDRRNIRPFINRIRTLLLFDFENQIPSCNLEK